MFGLMRSLHSLLTITWSSCVSRRGGQRTPQRRLTKVDKVKLHLICLGAWWLLVKYSMIQCIPPPSHHQLLSTASNCFVIWNEHNFYVSIPLSYRKVFVSLSWTKRPCDGSRTSWLVTIVNTEYIMSWGWREVEILFGRYITSSHCQSELSSLITAITSPPSLPVFPKTNNAK